MTIFCYCVILLAALWVALSRLPAGTEGHMPLPYLIALIPFLWIPLTVIVVWAVATHDWGLACVSGAVAITASSQRIDYWGKAWNTKPNTAAAQTKRETSRNASNHSPQPTQPAEAPAAPAEELIFLPSSFRVMTLNCRFGRADAADIVKHIRQRNIDVLALQEVTDELIERLDAEQLGEMLPYRQFGDAKDSDNGGFNAIFSRVKPTAMSPSAVEIPAADVPFITMVLEDGRAVMMASAHPKSPMRGCRDWSKGIMFLGKLAHGTFIGNRDIAVVMGDLNSSIEHPSFRMLIKAGFRDASLAQAKGPNLTFPSWIKWPRIELDHVLFTPGLKPSGVESFEINNTDHLALTATLTLA
ncbi:endonuclease/exonuclease/phosphatase family protein [Bifidobacterium oedipodis]|uniref:Endonuclease n=1 Tax=Bifidobacterium oedipodis TaxID=2675322 RepID=A0A7Y0HUW3_9BIFI|nr:endonuclease/exonuclease/phosphatase family protein [Bifidobacterium sp. DSM 109957]NMM95194.1 endonuclease [Bifidobacterium sp. DSM 109957]